MNVTTDRTVRELALEIPSATRVFEKMGIDYCCGGTRSLSEACDYAGVELKAVEIALTLASHSETDEPDFQNTTLETLINHIVVTHHSFTRLEIARLNALLDRVCMAHGERHPELLEIYVLFRELGAELETHMTKEERVLFPYVIRMEAADAQQVRLFRPPFGTVTNPVRMLMLEHDRAGDIFRTIRKLTSDYAVPPDTCISYRTLYEALEALEKDVHQHIHLENNILFPKAIEMEFTFGSSN